MNKLLIIFVGIVAVGNAISIFDLVNEEWREFKMKYSKSYATINEEKFRMRVFMDNKYKIAKHNQQFEAGDVSHKLAMNRFGDILHHEFVNQMNGFNRTTFNWLNDSEEAITFIEAANVELPSSIDWRKKGAVTEIKDQGQCGSCWAFSATGSLEGQHFRKTGKLVSLSEQNLVDCSRKYGNEGCDGGLMDQAFKYIKENHGIDTEKSYPYKAEDGKCHYDPNNSGATDNGFVDLPSGDEQKLVNAIATIGPISVGIDASCESFQFYHSGIYYDRECSSTQLDHGVLAVGYGSDENNRDFYIVKNSWGTEWGNDGYILMARNRKNHCGIASSASYPIV